MATNLERIKQYRIMLLAIVLWREARGEGRDGMVAVACVIRNRMRAGWYGRSLHRNITAKNQFTSISVAGDPNLRAWPTEDDPTIVTAVEVSDAILYGNAPDITGGALYYEHPAAANSEWFRLNVRERLQVTARIGRQVFYA